MTPFPFCGRKGYVPSATWGPTPGGKGGGQGYGCCTKRCLHLIGRPFVLVRRVCSQRSSPQSLLSWAATRGVSSGCHTHSGPSRLSRSATDLGPCWCCDGSHIPLTGRGITAHGPVMHCAGRRGTVGTDCLGTPRATALVPVAFSS